MVNVLGNAKIVFLADWVLNNVTTRTRRRREKYDFRVPVKTFTIFYLSIYYFKAKVRLILTLIMVILGNVEIADWVLSNSTTNLFLRVKFWTISLLRTHSA